MNSPSQFHRELYKIALAIGNTTELEPMLEESLTAYCESLGCMVGEVYLLETLENSKFTYQRFFSHSQNQSKTFPERPEMLKNGHVFDSAEKDTFTNSIPQTIILDNDYFGHVLDLPDLGAILLVKKDTPLSGKELKHITPLNIKLSNASQICLKQSKAFANCQKVQKENGSLLLKNQNLKESRKALLRMISQLQQTNDDYQEWDNSFRALFENEQSVYFQINRKGNLTYISESINNYSGFDASKMLNVNIDSMFFDPNDFKIMLKNLARHKQIVDYEIHIVNTAGKLVYTAVNAHANYDSDGKIIGFEGNLMDIAEWDFYADNILDECEKLENKLLNNNVNQMIFKNEIIARKTTEKTMRRLDLQNQQLLAVIDAVLIGIDSDDRITLWNNNAENAFGIPANTIIGKQFPKCGVQWDWDKMVEAISQCLKEDRPVSLPEFYHAKPYQHKPLNLTINPFNNDENARAGLLIVGESK